MLFLSFSYISLLAHDTSVFTEYADYASKSIVDYSCLSLEKFSLGSMGSAI